VTFEKVAHGASARVRVLLFAGPNLVIGAAADRWLRVGSGVSRYFQLLLSRQQPGAGAATPGASTLSGSAGTDVCLDLHVTLLSR
jgi:hypothetical protein